MNTSTNSKPPSVKDLTPEFVSEQLEQRECLLIDVREPGEFEADRIPGALLFPLSEFDATFLPFDGNRRIILHCGTGKRSRKAATLVRWPGISTVAHLEGGIGAWKKAGLPTIQFDPSTGKWRRFTNVS